MDEEASQVRGGSGHGSGGGAGTGASDRVDHATSGGADAAAGAGVVIGSGVARARRGPSTGLTWPLVLAAVVGVIASFGVAIMGTLLTEPLASEPIESGPYVLQADGTQQLDRGWLWPAPAEWGKPDQYQVQRNWLSTIEMAATSKSVINSSAASASDTSAPQSFHNQMNAGLQQRSACGWPVWMFEVRDPPNYGEQPLRFAFAAWHFEYRPQRAAFLIFPAARTPAGSVSMAKSLPTRIYWPGLAVNTIFFGVLFLVMFILPGRAKIARRRRLGLCLACGYDLAGLARCPECGLAAGGESPANSAMTPPPVP